MERAHRHRRRWWIPLVIALGVLLIAGGTLAGYGWSLSRQFADNLQRGGEVRLPPPQTPGPGVPDHPTADVAATGAVNVVLLGVDRRDGDKGRSDSLMLAHLTADHRALYLISFPRDMWVTIPGRGKDKINAAYAYGGTELTVRTLQEMLGIRVDHAAMIDMEGFVRLTDAVGGVSVTNEHAFSREGYDFPRGTVQLEGEKALAFVRERKHLPRGDLDRARNQRLVVRAIIDKALSPSFVANPAAFSEFVSRWADTMTVDESLTPDRAQSLFLSLRLTPGGIHEMQAPLTGFGTSPGGASIDVVDEPRLAELGTALRQDTVGEYFARYHPS